MNIYIVIRLQIFELFAKSENISVSDCVMQYLAFCVVHVSFVDLPGTTKSKKTGKSDYKLSSAVFYCQKCGYIPWAHHGWCIYGWNLIFYLFVCGSWNSFFGGGHGRPVSSSVFMHSIYNTKASPFMFFSYIHHPFKSIWLVVSQPLHSLLNFHKPSLQTHFSTFLSHDWTLLEVSSFTHSTIPYSTLFAHSSTPDLYKFSWFTSSHLVSHHPCHVFSSIKPPLHIYWLTGLRYMPKLLRHRSGLV